MFAFDDRDDPLRGLEQRQPELVGESLDHGGDGRVAVELHLAAEEAVGVDAAEHDVASVTVGSLRRRCRSTPGPGSAPALRGPTRNAPPSSTYAMEPPPAPIVWMSIIGTSSGIAGDPGVAGGRLDDAALRDDRRCRPTCRRRRT